MTDPRTGPVEPAADTGDEDLVEGAEDLPQDIRDDDLAPEEFTAAEVDVDPDVDVPESGDEERRRRRGRCRRGHRPRSHDTEPLAASPVAVWRAAEAVVVLAALAILAQVLGAPRTSLFLRWPEPPIVRWSIIGFLVAGPVALVVGPILARPFVGEIRYDVTIIGAVVPALPFAIANGTMEELAYCGALLGWSSRVMGVAPAVVGQAVVFGLAHSGSDVVGNNVPLMVALGVGGLIAGIIAVRTARSCCRSPSTSVSTFRSTRSRAGVEEGRSGGGGVRGPRATVGRTGEPGGHCRRDGPGVPRRSGADDESNPISRFATTRCGRCSAYS